MSLKIVKKQIETRRLPWKEGVVVGLRPFPQSEMVILQDVGYDAVATAKRRWVHCLAYIEGLVDESGETIDPKLTEKIDVNGIQIPLKEAIFDFPAIIGFPIELTKWIQTQIDELTYPLGDVAKNLTSSQDGTQAGPLASNAETQKSEPENSLTAEHAPEDN